MSDHAPTPQPSPAPTPDSSPAPSSGPRGMRAAGGDRSLSVEAAAAELGRRRREGPESPPGGSGGSPAPGQPPGPETAPGPSQEPAAAPPRTRDPLDPRLEAEEPAAGEDEPAEDQAPGADETVELVIEGKTVGLPASEVIKLAQQGYDYTRKTQALATTRKELEARNAELAQVMPLVQEILKAAQEQATKTRPMPSPEEFARLKDTDPFAAMQILLDAEHHRQLGALQANVQDTWQKEQERILNEGLQKEQEELVRHIPAWRNPEARRAMQAELAAFAQELGFSEQELAHVYDHRMIRVLHLAALQHRTQKRAPTVEGPAAAPRTAAAPGGQTPRWPTNGRNIGHLLGEVRRADERLTKEGSIDAAAALLRAKRATRSYQRPR